LCGGLAALQGMQVAPAAVALTVGLLLRYAVPIPEGLTDQVCAAAAASCASLLCISQCCAAHPGCILCSCKKQ
jgi:hypothetical protein